MMRDTMMRDVRMRDTVQRDRYLPCLTPAHYHVTVDHVTLYHVTPYQFIGSLAKMALEKIDGEG
jgi:hypothetical protein